MNIQENKSEFEQIRDIVYLWLSHWYYFVISMAICLALAFIYLKTKTPVMKVTAQVGIRQDESLANAPSVSRNQSLLNVFGIGRNTQNIEDETIKMKSQGYVKKVVSKYSLNLDYKQSEFFGLIKNKLYDQSPIVLSVDEAISDTIAPVIFKIDMKKDRINVKMERGRKTLGEYDINSFPYNMKTPLGTFIISKSEYFDIYKEPMKINVFLANYDYMTQIYRQAIKVDFEKKTSDLIQLSMNTENPLIAKKILNEMIATYNAEWEEDKDLVTGKTIDFIDNQLKLVDEKLLQADQAIKSFKDHYNLTDIEADVKYYLTISGELQPKLLEAESQLKMIDLIVEFVMDERNKYSLFPLSSSMATPAIADIIAKYNDVLYQRNDMYKTNSQGPLVKELNEMVESQREALLRSVDNVKKGIQIQAGELKKKESEIKSKIGKIPEIENNYLKLRREQELQQTLYIFSLEMQEQIRVKGVSLLPKLKIIDEPYVINKPVEPSLMKVAIIALFFGGIVLPLSAIYGFPIISSFLRKRKEK